MSMEELNLPERYFSPKEEYIYEKSLELDPSRGLLDFHSESAVEVALSEMSHRDIPYVL